MNYALKSNMDINLHYKMSIISHKVMWLCYILWSGELVSTTQSLRCGQRRFWSQWLCVRDHILSCPATLLLVFPLLKPSGWTAVSAIDCVLFLHLTPLLHYLVIESSPSRLTSSFYLPLTSSVSPAVCVLCIAVCVTALVLSWCMYANLHYLTKSWASRNKHSAETFQQTQNHTAWTHTLQSI